MAESLDEIIMYVSLTPASPLLILCLSVQHPSSGIVAQCFAIYPRARSLRAVLCASRSPLPSQNWYRNYSLCRHYLYSGHRHRRVLHCYEKATHQPPRPDNTCGDRDPHHIRHCSCSPTLPVLFILCLVSICRTICQDILTFIPGQRTKSWPVYNWF